VIVSGDSDFSPLVSKLRENAKRVIGVGVKSATSDLLVDACNEFIYYDDLIKPRGRKAKAGKSNASAPKGEAGETKEAALDLVLDIVEALFHEREDVVWGSMVKQTLKRKRPNFSEAHYGYRSFNELLEDASTRGLLVIEKDVRSGGYQIRGFGTNA
jgi:hypothetical protein